SGEFENARKAAQLQLRSVTDLNQRKELVEIVRKAYDGLAPYRFPSFQLATTARTEFLIVPSKSESPPTHHEIANELLYLGLFDEAAPELTAARSETQTAENTAQ